jgi:hypothetical protein
MGFAPSALIGALANQQVKFVELPGPCVTGAFTKGLGDQGPGYAEIIAASAVGTVWWEGP